MVTQAIKPGYKQTEIGVIPEDWNLETYGYVFDFLNTATYSRAELSESGDVLYVHYGDIHTRWNHFLDLKSQSLPVIDKTQQKNYSLIKEGDVIMADASEDYEGIGKSVEVKNIEDKKVISGLHTFLLRDRKEILVYGLKGYVHSNPLVKKQFDRLATGMKVFGVSKNNLKTVLIPFPKEEKEQEAIAQALSKTDELLKQLDKLIIKKKNIKKGVMQELLIGKKRLPGFNGEWETKEFENFIELNKGQQLNKSQLTEKGEFPDWNGGIEPSGYTHKWNAEANTITISEGGNSCGFVNYCITRFWCGGHCYALRILNNMIKDYLYQLLKFKESQIMALRIGSGLPNIQKKNLYEFELYIPKDIKEQQAISQVLSEMDAEIEELESKRDKYKMIKEGMMQQLLTGRIRLKWN